MAGQNDFRIFLHKEQVDGESVVSSASPVTGMGGSPKTQKQANFISKQRAYALSMRAYNTFVQDLRAEGNEGLATNLSNVSSFAASALIAFKFPPAAIPMAVNGVISQIQIYRNRQRETRNIEFEIEQKGVRLTRGQRASYLE